MIRLRPGCAVLPYTEFDNQPSAPVPLNMGVFLFRTDLEKNAQDIAKRVILWEDTEENRRRFLYLYRNTITTAEEWQAHRERLALPIADLAEQRRPLYAERKEEPKKKLRLFDGLFWFIVFGRILFVVNRRANGNA